MSTDNTPAFPGRYRNNTYGTEHPTPGMELRDFFAAPIAAEIAVAHITKGFEVTPEFVAKQAYLIADAMMKERVK